jgi:hypothetical protein
MLQNSSLLSRCFLGLVLKLWLSRLLVLAGSVVLLFACQTELKIAGNNHQLVGAKWRALAVYAESKLIKHGITISAKLVVVNSEGNEEFRLRKIKFSYSADVFNVDLLVPSFEQKYVCDPKCYQLLEYKSGDGRSGETMLTHFFNQHEFELFKFYGDLVLLSEKLETVHRSSGALLGYYLKSLTDEKYSFESTEDFIAFLDKALNEESFVSFINDPNSQNSSFLKSYAVSPDDGWDLDTDVALELNSTNSENGENLTIEEDDIWLSSDIDSPEVVFYQAIVNEQENTINSWLNAKSLPIEIGENVCSYENNLFGIVTSLTNQDVVVELLGQGKMLTEGILQDLPSGGLFSNYEGFSYIPMADSISLSIVDVATCYLE